MRGSTLAGIAGALAIAWAASAASAAVIAGDSFDYTSGAQFVSGLNGGYGWAGAWDVGHPVVSLTGSTGGTPSSNSISDNIFGTGNPTNSLNDHPDYAQVNSAGLTYPGFSSAGLSALFQDHSLNNASGSTTRFPGVATRAFKNAQGIDGSTYWTSVLFSLGGIKTARYNLTFSDGTNTTVQSLMSLGNPSFNGGSNYNNNGNTAGSEITMSLLPDVSGGSTIYTYTGSSNDTSAHLYVFSIQTNASGTNTVTAYVDPNLANDPSTWAAATSGTLTSPAGASITGIQLFTNSQNSTSSKPITMDEFRWGTTAADTFAAVPTESIPEPASVSLLGIGGLAMVLRRRRA